MNGVLVDREALDNAMVDALADAMKAKLARAREKGRGGWENPAECSVRDLWDMLIEHAHKPNLDMVDVANLAGMVWWRLEHVLPDPTVLSEHLAALALPAQAAADAAGVQDEERLEYHKSEMRRLEGGERETRQLWSAHMNLAEGLDMRIRAEKRVAYWETHLRALEEQS